MQAMTNKQDAADDSVLALYKALTTMGLSAVLLLATLDIIGDDMMSAALHPGFGFHPASFVLFLIVVAISGKRQGIGLLYFPKNLWNYLARATTVLLISLTLLRGYEHFTGNVLAWLEPMLGARGIGSYSSFWTLAGLTALHTLDAHCHRNLSQYSRWFIYALFLSVFSLGLHQLSDIFQGYYFLEGLSVLSATWLLAFAAFIFPRSVAYQMLFDLRAPKTNVISATGLVLVLFILLFLEALVSHSGLSLTLSAFLLLGLPILVSAFRPQEIEARIARGEIDEQGNSLAFVPAPRNLDVEASTGTELSTFERGVGSLLFRTDDWKRYATQAGLTFLLAYGAILISRTAESDIAMLWWANIHLAFTIFNQKDAQYLKTLATFAVVLVAANITAGNTLLASVLLTAVNATEGALIGILVRTVFGLQNTGLLLTMTQTFTIRCLMLFIALATGVLGLTAIIGSALIGLVFDVGVFDNIAPWFFGSVLGMFSLMPLLVGLILEVGLRYEKLTPKIPYLGPLCILYAFGVFSFYAFAPTSLPFFVPHMLFIVTSIPLVLLPSLKLAGALTFFNSFVYYTLAHSRWVGDGPTVPISFLMVLVPSLITIGLMARHQYARSKRAEQRALDFAPNALLTLDDDGRILSISKNAQEWFEVDASRLYGKRLLGFFENKKALAEELEQFVQNTPSGTFEAKAIRRLSTGQELVFSGSVRGNNDASLPYSYVVSLLDITKEHELEREKEELIDRSKSIIFVQDMNWNTLQCSNAWVAFTGYSREETLASDFHDFLHPDELERATYERGLLLDDNSKLEDTTAPYRLVTKSGDIKLVKIRTILEDKREGGRFIATFIDVTELVAAQSFNEQLLDKSPAIILTENEEFKIQSCSEAWVRQLGYTREETVGREFIEFFVPEQRDIVRNARAKFRNGTMDEGAFSADLLRKDGSVVNIRMNARVDKAASYWRLILTITDVTELEQQRRYNDTLLNRNSSIMLTQDKDWKLLSCSQAWVDQLGYSRDETVGHDLVEFMHPEDAEASRAFRDTKLLSPRPASIIKNTVRFKTKSGEERIIEMQSVIEEIDGEWRNIITLVDITEIMQTQSQLAYMVEHDELTGLLSRRGMQQRFSDGARMEDKVLYLLDIDHFKSVNDSFGHEAGDTLLRTLGETMRKLSEEDGDAIRLGGEEFAVIRRWYGWEEAARFGESLRQVLEETIVHWNNRDIHRTASIGFAPLHTTDRLTDVLHLADLVAREAKSTGRNQVIGATEAMMENLRKRGVFIRADEIQAALEKGEMHYEVQPIWNMENQSIEGFEALVRWDKPDGTRVMPGLFIDLLYKVIREPEYKMLKNEMRRECLAKLSAFPNQYVSFNFTLEQLGYEGAAQEIIETLESIKDHPGREIVIEVSERAMTARVNSALLRKEMSSLQEAGYKIALDDFGVEFSNINRLQEYPISIVKIDKSLISNIATSEVQRATLEGLSLTFKTLGIKMILEGVETEKQADILYIAGLHTHQGFLHARPMPPEDVEANCPCPLKLIHNFC